MKKYLFLHRSDGTQIALVTFGTEARLYFNLGDAAVDTTEKAIEAIDRVKYIGGLLLLLLLWTWSEGTLYRLRVETVNGR